LLRRRPYLFGGLAVVALVVLTLPVLSMRTAMPSINVVPQDDQSRQGHEQIQAGFGPGAPGALQIVTPAAGRQRVVSAVQADPGIAQVLPPERAGGQLLIEAVPTSNPSSPQLGATIDRLRSRLPSDTLIGGLTAENHDLEAALVAKTPVVIGVVLTLGFLVLLAAFHAPVAAAIGVVTNLLATGAAFGIAKWIFQDGHLAGLLGFEPQGFLDAWAPVFFFAMIFAISMDYTVFLLASARERWDRSHDPRAAAVGGLADSGRVIFAAAAVMVAVFFTFALSGPLPPKEMGVILGVSVLLDAMLVRLVLLPALMRAFGRHAWALPRRLERVLPAVRFGHS
jgi:putative drug exporter of the RND superfamily